MGEFFREVYFLVTSVSYSQEHIAEQGEKTTVMFY